MADASHPSGVSPKSRRSPRLLPVAGGQLRDRGAATASCAVLSLGPRWLIPGTEGTCARAGMCRGGLSPVLPEGSGGGDGKRIAEI